MVAYLFRLAHKSRNWEWKVKPCARKSAAQLDAFGETAMGKALEIHVSVPAC